MPSTVEFGLFDWIDRRDVPLGQIYEERLRLLEYADAAGFVGYHLAEHHFTPLGMAPSPGIFLSALAQRTRRLRFGPLVYLLPLYNPLRLLVEVCMLDQLSGGRVELGVGRGVSPYELRYFGVDPEQSRAIFREALEVLRLGFTGRRLTFHGRYYTYDDVPIELECAQRPYPPLWYPTTNPESVGWAAEQGFHLMGLGPAQDLRANAERYRAVWAQHCHRPDRYNAHVARPRIGLVRLVYVADSDERAVADARPAYARWFDNFDHLWRAFGDPRQAFRRDFDAARANRTVLLGSPDSVRAQLVQVLEESACDYAALVFTWGSLSYAQALRSMELFVSEILPAFQ